MHVSENSTVADHCRKYALSDPDDANYQLACDHQHDNICDRCTMLANTINCIEEALAKQTKNLTDDLKEEMIFRVRQAKKNIESWKSHLLRYVNQDEARIDILEALDETSVFLTQDWAMKFIPRKYRESQRDWFAKRGMSWHITVATRKQDGQLQMLTFVHIFESCNQEYPVVLAIMSDVIERLKVIMPKLRLVFHRQDNAGCYRNGPNVFCAKLLGHRHGVAIKRMDFSDPQGGKGACDRKAATIKSHMRIYLNEGNDITSPDHMKQAILSSGGVPAVSVTLCGPTVIPNMQPLSLDGVSQISNVEYSEDGIRIWKAYKIGPGKLIPSKDLKLPTESQLPSLTVIERSESQFTAVKSKTPRTTEPAVVAEETAVAPPEARESNSLFTCPEEGCTRTFLKHSSLEQHLDCGKHQFALERETIFDKATLYYAEKLEGQDIGIPQLDASNSRPTQNRKEPLPMGWALRSSTGGNKRFSKKQKDYLLKKFQIGETTGQKANPVSVARSMMTAKDIKGNRLFNSDEFLTSKQITSFFSRVAKKKKLPSKESKEMDSTEDYTTDELEDAVHQYEVEEFADKARSELSVKHPLVFDAYDICDLAAKSKLEKFAIPMLKQICQHFAIDTTDIKAKRKKPYVMKIMALVESCECQA